MAIDLTVALISLAQAKEQLKITGANEDAIVGDFVNMVSAMVESYVGRGILSRSYVEYYDGNETDELMLKGSPIKSLTDIWNSTGERTFDDNSKMDKANDIYIETNSGIIRTMGARGQFQKFFRGRANIKVAYVSGYDLADVPYDIQLAVRIWLGTVYMKYYNRRYEFISANAGQNSTTFIEKDIPLDVKRILDAFKDKFGNPTFSYRE